MDERQNYERFDVDNDYEGVEQIGDEYFIAAKSKSTSKQLKIDCMACLRTATQKERDGAKRGHANQLTSASLLALSPVALLKIPHRNPRM